MDCFRLVWFGPGAHFPNGFSITVQIRWEFHLSAIWLLVTLSPQNFAHVTIAQLSCHVQNGAAIIQLQFGWEQNEMSIAFDLSIGRLLSYPMMTSLNETISALLALCTGNSPVIGEFPAQRPGTRSFDVSFDLRLNERLSKHSWDANYALIMTSP